MLVCRRLGRMVVCRRLGSMIVVEVLKEWVELKVRNDGWSERLGMMDILHGRFRI